MTGQAAFHYSAPVTERAVSLAAGRCSGCGMVRASSRVIAEHIRECGSYLALWRTSPDRALSPEAEFTRWQEEDRSQEAKDLVREIRLNGIFADIDRARNKAQRRFRTPPDILADDDTEESSS